MFVEAGSHNDKSTYTNEIYMGMKTSKFKALRPVWPGVLGTLTVIFKSFWPMYVLFYHSNTE